LLFKQVFGDRSFSSKACHTSICLRTQVLTQPAEQIEVNRYGEKYAIRACLRGVNGVELNILTIWMVANGTTKFVTLVPDKGAN
jgi:hypothetical protein